MMEDLFYHLAKEGELQIDVILRVRKQKDPIIETLEYMIDSHLNTEATTSSQQPQIVGTESVVDEPGSPAGSQLEQAVVSHTAVTLPVLEAVLVRGERKILNQYQRRRIRKAGGFANILPML